MILNQTKRTTDPQQISGLKAACRCRVPQVSRDFATVTVLLWIFFPTFHKGTYDPAHWGKIINNPAFGGILTHCT